MPRSFCKTNNGSRLSPDQVHRDVKPENVLLQPSGHLILTDFGCAKEYRELSAEDEMTEQNESASGDTMRAGALSRSMVGTVRLCARDIISCVIVLRHNSATLDVSFRVYRNAIWHQKCCSVRTTTNPSIFGRTYKLRQFDCHQDTRRLGCIDRLHDRPGYCTDDLPMLSVFRRCTPAWICNVSQVRRSTF